MRPSPIASQDTGSSLHTHRAASICLLGKPALFVDGRLQPFGGPRKAIALLAYVLLHRDRVLSRAAIAEQFWPDEEDENARASLRRNLHRALAALPEPAENRPWLIADKVTLRWNPEAQLDVDTYAYERLSSAGQRAAAVELYRGDYLEDFFDEWVLPERERLRELQAANLVVLVEERRRALDYPSAIAFALSLQRLDPLREDAIRRLMSLRFAAGDRSGALADFESFSRRLRDELSADPMPETMALREAIRSNDLSTLERAPAQAQRPARSGFPFAGRTAALRTLRSAWEAAARGSPLTAIVSGEAGIGKSRLIGELMALAEAQGGRVLFGGTSSIEAEPYQPLAEALRSALPLLRFDRLEAAKLAALSSLVPEVRDRMPSVPTLLQLEPEHDRLRLFDAVQSALEHLAEKRPLLVVLEDLHWAGAATIDLVEFLARRLGTTSILIVVSFREEEVDGSHALRRLLRRLEPKRSSRVAIGALEEDEIRTLIAGVPDIGSSEVVARELSLASEGNALFVTELLRERLQGAANAVPAGIADMAAARVNRLSPAARSIVETAAVVGASFDAEIVRQACGWSFAEVVDALDELLDRALVRLAPRRGGDYAFSHQLVHAAVYDTVDTATRRGLHRRVARTLEQLFSNRPLLSATIARHYAAAGLQREAVARFLEAVRYALDVFAQDEAIALASQALEICTDDRDRFELHRLREEGAARAGDGAERRIDCDAMNEIARALDDDELLGIALCRANALFLERYDRNEQAAAIEQLAALSERTGSPRWAIEAALARARLEITSSNHRVAEEILQKAEEVAGALADDALAFEYWYVRAFNAGHDAPQTARTFLERARARGGGNPLLTVRALRAEANIAEVAGDQAGRHRAATELLAFYSDTGDLDGQAIAHQSLALAAEARLDPTAFYDHTSKALALFERLQKPQGIAGVLINRGIFTLQFGDFAAAEADYTAGRAMCDRFGFSGYGCIARSYLALLASLKGNYERGRTLAFEALAFAREHALAREEYFALCFLGHAERELGLLESAREHLAAALSGRRVHNPGAVPDALVEIVPAYLALGEYEEALAAATELLQGLAAGASVTFPAQAVWVAADAYAAVGEPERARALRADAKGRLQELAGRIGEEPSRAGYLALRVHRTILS